MFNIPNYIYIIVCTNIQAKLSLIILIILEASIYERVFCPRGFCPEGAYVLLEGVLSKGVLSGGGFVPPS